MYRRYTLDEVKQKVIYALQSSKIGLSGIELAQKTGINRITLTKYLDILLTMGLITKKKAGSVNVWFLEEGTGDFDLPFDYLRIQQKFINAILDGDYNYARLILLNITSSSSSSNNIRILTDIILPTINTFNELQNRGRMSKTERLTHLSLIGELVDLVKFNTKPDDIKTNAHSIFISSSENQSYYAKLSSVGFYALGWTSSIYLGNIESYIDPFYDLDLQRYILRLWNDRRGLLFVCIFSNDPSTVQFLYAATSPLKTRLKGQLEIIVIGLPEISEISEIHFIKNVADLFDWSESQYRNFSI